ncbi:MAG TPA: hypothetical protein VFA12_20220 [Stellaceae bacterium]|nr:hypothetical protein [Stellaceae bacterium]
MFAPLALKSRRAGGMRPGVPKIDWSNPLTKGLVACFFPVGNKIIDLVSGVYLTPTGTVSRSLGPEGVEANSAGTGYWSLAALPTWQVTTQGTLLYSGRILARSFSNFRIFGLDPNPTNASPFTALTIYDGTPDIQLGYNNGSAFEAFTSGPNPSNGDVVSMVVTLTMGGAVNWYNKGAPVSSGTAVAGTIAYTAGTMYIGGSSAGDGDYAMALAALYNVAIPASAAQELSRDPTRFLIFPDDVVSSILGAAAPSLISFPLTGVAAAGAVGGLVPSVLINLGTVSASAAAQPLSLSEIASFAGASGSSAAGSVVTAGSVALNSAAGSGAFGAIADADQHSLSAVAGSGAAGTLSESAANALAGQSGAGAVGSLSDAASNSLSGATGLGASGIFGPAESVTLPAATASAAVGVLNVDAGGSASVDLTGASVSTAAGTLGFANAFTLPAATAATGAGSVEGSPEAVGGSVSASGAAGGVARAEQIPIAGTAAMGTAGAASASWNGSLGSASATASVSSIIDSVVASLVREAAFGAAGTITVQVPTNAVPLTGVAAMGIAGILGVLASAVQANANRTLKAIGAGRTVAVPASGRRVVAPGPTRAVRCASSSTA